ncbi:MAG: hypothetical protein ABL883_14760 [Terricaulis sp.]
MRGVAMLNYDVFEAFRSAGADDKKVRRAAEALSGAAFAEELSDLKATVKLHTWMIGAVFAMNVARLVRLWVPS